MKESITYIAFDGQSFKTKEECEKHEKEIKEFQKEEYYYKFNISVQLRPELIETVECSRCRGSGEIYDIEFTPFSQTEPFKCCPECCNGKKTVYNNKSPIPEIPGDLVQHMAKAWNEYWKKYSPKGIYYERKKTDEV